MFTVRLPSGPAHDQTPSGPHRKRYCHGFRADISARAWHSRERYLMEIEREIAPHRTVHASRRAARKIPAIGASGTEENRRIDFGRAPRKPDANFAGLFLRLVHAAEADMLPH